MDMSPDEVQRANERLRELGGEPVVDPENPFVVAQLAGDLPIDRDAHLDVEALAAATGVPPVRLFEILDHLGIDIPPVGVVRFTDQDVELVRNIAAAPDRWVLDAEIAELLRVIGRAMATAAEASVAYHLRSIEPRVSSLVDWVDANHEMALQAVALGAHLGAVFRHHLRQSIDLQRTVNAATGRGEVLDIAVAFVDLTGFTGLSLDTDLLALGDLVARLDVVATDSARAHRCRVVKLIGDEAMFVGPGPPEVVAAADLFCRELAADDVTTHGAVTAGHVIMNAGDYFGPAVNLAARLVNLAGPGELLCDGTVASVCAAENVGARTLRGFPEPVEVYRLTR